MVAVVEGAMAMVGAAMEMVVVVSVVAAMAEPEETSAAHGSLESGEVAMAGVATATAEGERAMVGGVAT